MGSECQDRYELVCRGEFAAIRAKLDQLDDAIRGNGKPGIQMRLDRLERVEAQRSRLIWVVITATAVMALSSLWRLVAG